MWALEQGGGRAWVDGSARVLSLLLAGIKGESAYCVCSWVAIVVKKCRALAALSAAERDETQVRGVAAQSVAALSVEAHLHVERSVVGV